MEYNIKPETKLQQAKKTIVSKCEDMYLATMMNLARFFKSQFLMNVVENYTKKKIQKLQSEIIKKKWDKVTLDKALDSIHKNDTNAQ